MLNVRVHLYSQSQPVEILRARNTYTKDGLFCVMLQDSAVTYKFPVQHIFRITEVDVPGPVPSLYEYVRKGKVGE